MCYDYQYIFLVKPIEILFCQITVLTVCVSCLGKLTDDVTEFVESWQENPPQGTPNWDNSFLSEPPCLTQSHESLQVWICTKGLLQHSY